MNQPARCGTTSGYTRHQLDGEKPCDACALAKAKYDERRRNAGENTLRNRIHAKAQGKARSELARRHAAEYGGLYRAFKAEFLAAEGLTPRWDKPIREAKP